MKRPLRDLKRGDVFRTADGRLWCLRTHLALSGECLAHLVAVEGDPESFGPDAEVEPLDLPALLARLEGLERENDFLRGQLSDLWQDRTGAAVGAEAERGAAADLARLHMAGWAKAPTSVRMTTPGWGPALGLERYLDDLRARGPCRPPVPPSRLEGALREVEAAVARWHKSGWLPGRPEEFALLARVREALGEVET